MFRSSRWETHCHGCGLCCYEKTMTKEGNWVIDLSDPCPWLDVENRRCKVYANRFKRYSRCRRLTLGRALFAPYLPPDCGYVRRFRPRWLSRLIGNRVVVKGDEAVS